MQIWHALFIGWVVVVAFWLLNHFYYQNLTYEEEYRQGRHPRS
jgi:heme O synthase-like polyprenyltransferase